MELLGKEPRNVLPGLFLHAERGGCELPAPQPGSPSEPAGRPLALVTPPNSAAGAGGLRSERSVRSRRWVRLFLWVTLPRAAGA